MTRIVGLIVVVVVAIPNVISAAESTTDSISVNKVKELFEKSKLIRVGVSVGPRKIRVTDENTTGFDYPSISPIDSTLQFDKRDKLDLIMSGVLAITPGLGVEKPPSNAGFWQRFCYLIRSRSTFLLNINLSNLTGDGAGFNQNIEGGIGYGISLHKVFAIGVTFERVFNRALRRNISEMEGRKLKVGGQPVTELDPENENLFRDDNLTAWSFKFIVFY